MTLSSHTCRYGKKEVVCCVYVCLAINIEILTYCIAYKVKLRYPGILTKYALSVRERLLVGALREKAS